ncbi:MAG: DNA cytosine methyltransferase [Cyanobacteria bacterium P01_G01_bin.54]
MKSFQNKVRKGIKYGKTVNSKPSVCCVDLFCGAGGLTHGLIRGGIHVSTGIDVDPRCRFPYEKNNDSKFVEKDVSDLSKNEISSFFGNARFKLLAGCAPCQPFSTYSRKSRHKQHPNKWSLVSDFGRLVKESNPDFVTMENVPQLLSHRVFTDFLKDLRNYNIWYQVIECVNYGIPQTRKRLVLLASKHGFLELLEPTKVDQESSTSTVRSSISHLPPLKAGETDSNDPLHTASSLSSLNLKRIKSSKPGGTWKDWDNSLLTKCHSKESGQTYPSVYGRMEWDAPSPTITTQCFGYGNGRFGHPKQDRAISLREAAILQTFPDSYIFTAPNEKIYFNRIGRLIGNAVPVRLGEVIAQSFVKHIEETIGSSKFLHLD